MNPIENFEKILSIIKFFNDKKSFPILRKGVSIILCGIITSFLFEIVYFKYTLPETLSFNAIYFFFVHGSFVIPALLYFFIWGITNWIFRIYLTYRNLKYNEKFTSTFPISDLEHKVLEFMNDKSKEERIINNIFIMMKVPTIDELELKIHRTLSQKQDIIEEYCILTIQSIIIIVFALMMIPYFGWLLFVFSMIFLFSILLLLIQFNKFLEILPNIIGIFVKAYKKTQISSE